MQYNPQQARQQWQNRVNNAQGHIFEDGIKAACQVYQGSGRAKVDKTPEPFRVRFTGAVLFLDYVHTTFEQIFGADIQK